MTKCAMCGDVLLPGDEAVTLPTSSGDAVACMVCVEGAFRSWCESQGEMPAYETRQ